MKIDIEAYQARWVNEFLAEEAIIGSTLIDFDPVIEHIGSTSVPGLCAKPTIDILVGLHTESRLDETIAPMIGQGYTYFKKYELAMPFRRLFARLKPLTGKAIPEIIGIQDEFVRGQDFVSLSNVHIVVKDTLHWHRHLALRDYLRAHANVSDEYARLKLEVAEREFRDTNDYNAAKDSFIKKAQAQALTWYNHRHLGEIELAKRLLRASE